MNGTAEITAQELGALLHGLLPIGLAADGATTRLAWTAEDELARGWFEDRAGELGRATERDAAGNLWAPPDAAAPWWALGSHLDSVLAGGRYDGALGVAAAFAVAAREPVGVIAFADEEGARFNTPTFGSRALVGRLEVEDVLARKDGDGVTLRDALLAAGVEPDGLASAPRSLQRLRGVLELHIDQTRDVARSGAPVAVVSGLAARLRMQAVLEGRADHAGTTHRDERRDALAAAARLIVRAEKLSLEEEEMLFTAARIEVAPNAPSTVPAHVRLWLDARAPHAETIKRWQHRLQRDSEEIARDSGVAITLSTAAYSPGRVLSRELRRVLAAGVLRSAEASSIAEVTCWAGHDAGVLGEVIPTGIILVRNETGISHAREEHVSLEDAAVGANALVEAVRGLR